MKEIKSIAIYGDSFAVSARELETSWFSILAKKFNCAVDNYGENGASLYSTYKLLKENYDRYDMSLFLVTHPNRFPTKLELSNYLGYIPGYNAIEYIRNANQNLGKMDDDILRDLEGWYKISNDEYVCDMHDLILDKVKSLGNNIIMVPCFQKSFGDRRKSQENIYLSLNELVQRQRQLLGISSAPETVIDLIFRENPNVMSAHLTPEFNDFFATVLYNRILTGSWDFSGYTEVQLNHDREYYYE